MPTKNLSFLRAETLGPWLLAALTLTAAWIFDAADAAARCPDPDDPRVTYIVQGMDRYGACEKVCCDEGERFYQDDRCGCACIDESPPTCAEDPDRVYVSLDPPTCSTIRYTCDPGWRPFSDDCGCGCERIEEPVCEPSNDPNLQYVGTTPLACGLIRFTCDPGWEYFADDCGCGCRKSEPPPSCEPGPFQEVYGTSAEICAIINYRCAPGWDYFHDGTCCGCVQTPRECPAGTVLSEPDELYLGSEEQCRALLDALADPTYWDDEWARSLCRPGLAAAGIDGPGIIVSAEPGTCRQTDPGWDPGFRLCCAPEPPTEPDLEVAKELTGAAGTTELIFTITVKNIGDAAAQDVTVTDALPPGLSLLQGSPPWTCTAAGDPGSGETVTCASGLDLAPGQQITVDLVVDIASRDAFKDLVNCAQAGGSAPGCTELPCPPRNAPGVRYSETRGQLQCAALQETGGRCRSDEDFFWGVCGCGCKVRPREPLDPSKWWPHGDLDSPTDFGDPAEPTSGGDPPPPPTPPPPTDDPATDRPPFYGSDLVVLGEKACVCGDFSSRKSRKGLLVSGREIKEETAGDVKVEVIVPEDLPPGEHVLEPWPGSSLEFRVLFEAIRIDASLDTERLWRGQGTPLRLRVAGTDRPVQIELVNRTPEIVRLEGGSQVVLETSGGADNSIETKVQGLRRGKFDIGWSVDLPGCPCDDE